MQKERGQGENREEECEKGSASKDAKKREDRESWDKVRRGGNVKDRKGRVGRMESK